MKVARQAVLLGDPTFTMNLCKNAWRSGLGQQCWLSFSRFILELTCSPSFMIVLVTASSRSVTMAFCQFPLPL